MSGGKERYVEVMVSSISRKIVAASSLGESSTVRAPPLSFVSACDGERELSGWKGRHGSLERLTVSQILPYRSMNWTVKGKGETGGGAASGKVHGEETRATSLLVGRGVFPTRS